MIRSADSCQAHRPRSAILPPLVGVLLYNRTSMEMSSFSAINGLVSGSEPFSIPHSRRIPFLQLRPDSTESSTLSQTTNHLALLLL